MMSEDAAVSVVPPKSASFESYDDLMKKVYHKVEKQMSDKSSPKRVKNKSFATQTSDSRALFDSESEEESTDDLDWFGDVKIEIKQDYFC